MKKLTYVLIALLSALMLAGCPVDLPTSDQVAHQQQEQMSAEGNQSVGMPAITNFAQKREFKMILELADQEKPTITYQKDMNGRFHKICDSIGFPIPAATQYTNPQYIAYKGSQVGVITLPQADPSGLYSPASADATWVLCLDPTTKKIAPFYAEDRVEASLFPLPGALPN